MKALDYHVDILRTKAWNTVGKIGAELAYHATLRLLVVFVVGLIVLHQAVFLGIDGGFRLINGEIEGGGEVGIFPWFALFGKEIVAAVAGNRPHDQQHGNGDECCANH